MSRAYHCSSVLSRKFVLPLYYPFIFSLFNLQYEVLGVQLEKAAPNTNTKVLKNTCKN